MPDNRKRVTGLCITRKVGESIMIGDDIEIRVVTKGVQGHMALCINAPDNVAVHRKEVWEAIKAGDPEMIAKFGRRNT